MKIYNRRIFWIILSFVVALGFNNITRQLSSIDSGVMVFLTLSSLSFILGTLLYTRTKDDKLKGELIWRFILSGMMIIFAFSLAGLVGDVQSYQRIVAFYSFDPDTILGVILTHLASFLNFSALFIFFYSSLELIYYFKNTNYDIISSRKFTLFLITFSLVLYLIFSGIIINLIIPLPKLETYTSNLTNETLLHISGERWVITINLIGFQEVMTDFHPTRFLIMSNGPITISVFAEKFPNIFNAKKCRTYYFSSVNEMAVLFGISSLESINRNNQLLLTYNYSFGSTKMNSINYYDYYDGYCFDFHITTDLGLDRDLNQTYNLLDSIKLINLK